MNKEYNRYTFKAKRLDSQYETFYIDWVYGFYLEENGKSYIYDINDKIKYLIDKKTLCQFTGIKDKNDKEIYENDITESDWGYKGIVDFDSFIYAKVEQTISDNIEVIGNKFDKGE